MRGRKDDQGPARREARGSPSHLGPVPGNVLKDIDIENGVELLAGLEVLNRTGRQSVTTAQRQFNLPGQGLVRFQTRPAGKVERSQQPRVGANAGAHFEHRAAHIGRNPASPVTLPVVGLFKEF